MIDIEKLSLTDRIKLYAEGDKENEIPPRTFDLSKSDTDEILACIETVRLLAEKDYPHNFQRERYDIAEYCYKMTVLQRLAKVIYNVTRAERN